MADPAVPSTPGKHQAAATNPSSPVKPAPATIDPSKRQEWSTFVYPYKHTEISTRDMLTKLCPNHVNQNGWWNRSIRAPRPPSTFETTRWIRYLNQLSGIIGANKNLGDMIEFEQSPDKAPAGHPTGTKSRPDILIYKKQVLEAEGFRVEDLHWSQLEGTGEIFSSNQTLEQSAAQAAAYTSYNLQARPDHVSVPGIWIKDKMFRIIFTDACQVFLTRMIEFKEVAATQLLFAFVWSLYYPQLDPTMTINLDVVPPTFNVRVDSRTHENLTLSFTGEAIGRRTTIMTKADDPDFVIKEQYIEKKRRFEEGKVLEKIHENGVFPGIVRIKKHGTVMRNRKETLTVTHEVSTRDGVLDEITRRKTRLVLKDRGIPLAKVLTIKKLLICLYDLLEVIRNADKHRNVLHRDISSGNILVREEPRSDGEAYATDLGDMCFCSCLLKKPRDQLEEPSLEERFEGDILLTDFDSAEDKDPNHPSASAHRNARTGTPIYMARVVRSGMHLRAEGWLPVMPAVHPDILTRYGKLHPERLDNFPQQQEKEPVIVEANVVVVPTEFRHEQRYDAESVFWYLVWWGLLAQPAHGYPEELIPAQTWTDLIGPNDRRHQIFVGYGEHFDLHSAYAPLIQLLDAMRKHLLVDSRFSEDKVKKHSEYLTEVFQRLILNFLIENQNEPFMVLEKSDEDRKVQQSSSGGATIRKSTKSNANTSAYRSTTMNSVNHSVRSVSLGSEIYPQGSSSTSHSAVDRPHPPIRPIGTRSSRNSSAKRARTTVNASKSSIGTKRSIQEVEQDPVPLKPSSAQHNLRPRTKSNSEISQQDPSQDSKQRQRRVKSNSGPSQQGASQHKKQRPLAPPPAKASSASRPESPHTQRRSTRRRLSQE